jgi:hypothetical protein
MPCDVSGTIPRHPAFVHEHHEQAGRNLDALVLDVKWAAACSCETGRCPAVGPAMVDTGHRMSVRGGTFD